jgi:hypothetical protein
MSRRNSGGAVQFASAVCRIIDHLHHAGAVRVRPVPKFRFLVSGAVLFRLLVRRYPYVKRRVFHRTPILPCPRAPGPPARGQRAGGIGGRWPRRLSTRCASRRGFWRLARRPSRRRRPARRRCPGTLRPCTQAPEAAPRHARTARQLRGAPIGEGVAQLRAPLGGAPRLEALGQLFREPLVLCPQKHLLSVFLGARYHAPHARLWCGKRSRYALPCCTHTPRYRHVPPPPLKGVEVVREWE